MDARDMEKITDTWAKYWTVKSKKNELGTYIREGRIKAVNQASADEQFDWLIKNAGCFCRDCVDGMNKKYSLYMDWSDNTCTHTRNPQIISGFMQG